MKKKNLFPIIFIIIVIIIALISILLTNTSFNIVSPNSKDYTPEEEISSKDNNKTIITLYFIDTETNDLKSEGKLIDSSELLENPYKKIVEYLIEGPSSDTLQKVFPENTKILNATINQNCVTLNFSEDLLNYNDDSQKYNIINCILNSLAELNEVSSIKFQINGATTDSLNEEYYKIY